VLTSRPRQATTAAILLIVFGVLGILAALLLISLINNDASHGQTDPAYVYVLFYLQLVLSLAEAACGIFVWQGKAWARTLAIAVCSINIIGGVLSLFSGVAFQAIVGVILNIVLIRLLANEDVKDWCR
jgi:hypothetical protein